VLRTPELFSSWLGATQIRDPEPGDLAFIRRMILNMDAPEHNRLRRIVSAVFTRRRLERFADQISDRRGTCSARSHLADAVICRSR
jgi:cytochrome P450